MTIRALLLSLVFTLTTAAQYPENECAGATYDTSMCLVALYKQVDAELNSEYQKALKSAADYDEVVVQKLEDSERKWIACREADCDAEHAVWGRGTGGTPALTMCLITHTRDRIAGLKSRYGQR